jgi:nitrate/nitrite transporter NarK
MVVRAITPAGASGKVFGFVSTGINLGAAGSPLLLGWILDQGGAWWLFVLVPAFLLAAMAAMLAARWASRG